MNVYIWTSGTLKNAYIGEVYEYSYDFRNKTNSQLQTDWWTLDDSSHTAYNSNGVYSTTNVTVRATRSLPSLVNAKKITFNEVMVVASTSYGSGASFRSYTGTTATKQKIFWIIVNKDQGYNMKWGYVVSSTQNFKQDITTTGTKTNSLVYDLVNKTITYTLDWTTYTGTLTDSNITDIKSNNGVFIYVWQINTTTTQVYIQSVWILVE